MRSSGGWGSSRRPDLYSAHGEERLGCVLVGDQHVGEAPAHRAKDGFPLVTPAGDRDDQLSVLSRELAQPTRGHGENAPGQRTQLLAIDQPAVPIERVIVDFAHHAERPEPPDAHPVELGEGAEPGRCLPNHADPDQHDVDVPCRLVDPSDLALLEKTAALALGGGKGAQDLDGQGIRADMRAVLGGHHADQRVREQVHELEGALARQGIDLQIAEPPLAQGADQLVERVTARESDPRAVGRHLLEVAGGGRPQVLLQLPHLAEGDHDRVPQLEAFHEGHLQTRPLRQLDLDPDQAIREGALQQPRHLGGREAQLAGDLLLVPLSAVVELHAPHHLADLVPLGASGG